MTFNLEQIKRTLTKKIFLQLYFIVFIILNIVDFLGYLTGDLDFFKKLLSWSIIGYVFYSASFTKIFIGKRKKIYDLVFILGFILMGIIKSLVYYAKEIAKSQEFLVFGPIIKYCAEIDVNKTFLIGLTIIIITSVILLNKNQILPKSFMGSLKLNEFLKFLKIDYLILILAATFFGFIVFNFFMEWFALAVDSIILVLGLIYYIFVYLHKHTNSKISSLLKTISNTGNSFYQNMIELFSNKKTFLIGVSLILTLHLVIDIGVYIMPYTLGNGNALYSEVLETPIFSLKQFESSTFYMDLNRINFNTTLGTSIFLINTISLIFLSLLLFLPFFIFYQNIQKNKFKLNKIIEIFLLIGIIIIPLVHYMPNLEAPLNLGLPDSQSIYGVEIGTSPIIHKITTNEKITFEILITTLILLIVSIESILITKSNFNKQISTKIIPLIILTFFIIYITIFYTATIRNEVSSIKDEIIPLQTLNTSKSFNKALEIYESPIRQKEKRALKTPLINLSHEIYPFSDATIETIEKNLSHHDYLILNLYNINPDTNYILNENQYNIYLSSPQDYMNNKFTKSNISIIYYLGINKFDFTKHKYYEDVRYDSLILSQQENKKTKAETFLEFLRFIFTSIFYIFGTIAYTIFFIKQNILKN